MTYLREKQLSIYVASSWRNQYQEIVVPTLRAVGHKVYDFKNPPNGAGFGWEQVALERDSDGLVEPDDYLKALQHERALEGFWADKRALDEADLCVLVLPSRKSAHLELGYALGAGKSGIVYHPRSEGMIEPELMYLACGIDAIVFTMHDLIDRVQRVARMRA